MENNIQWSQEQMFEVLLKEPDDFLKNYLHLMVRIPIYQKMISLEEIQ